MLEAEDIKKLTKYQLEVFKDVFLTKEDKQEIKDDINRIQNSVDNLAKTYKDDHQEIIVLNNRMETVENFADKAAPKLGLKFKH